ncbi:MAG: hypothetical protein P8N50_01605 [Actinomycetota bacterium]|nr:hypothetical protein [Actinomycetota bacterium]
MINRLRRRSPKLDRRVTSMYTMNRAAYIEGLNVDGMMPADIEVFIKMLPKRMPMGVKDEQVDLLTSSRRRIVDIAVSVGVPDVSDLAASDVESVVEAIIGQMSQLKRRHWKSTKAGDRLIDTMRESVGQISADLHELAGH